MRPLWLPAKESVCFKRGDFQELCAGTVQIHEQAGDTSALLLHGSRRENLAVLLSFLLRCRQVRC